VCPIRIYIARSLLFQVERCQPGLATFESTKGSLTLDPWASRRRRELLELLDKINPSIEELDRAVISEAEERLRLRRA
jgi:hypothetical protein